MSALTLIDSTRIVFLNGNGVYARYDVVAHRSGCSGVTRHLSSRAYTDAGTFDAISRDDAFDHYNADFLDEPEDCWPIHFCECLDGLLPASH